MRIGGESHHIIINLQLEVVITPLLIMVTAFCCCPS